MLYFIYTSNDKEISTTRLTNSNSPSVKAQDYITYIAPVAHEVVYKVAVIPLVTNS
jgi:hypothetical protein